MIEIFLTYILPALAGALPTGGLMFWGYNKKLKALEVKKEEVSNADQTIQLWRNLYDTIKEENNELKEKAIVREDKIVSLREELDTAYEKYHQSQLDSEKKERHIQELTWHKCVVNGCPNRKPPHKHDMTDNEDGE